ncbi:MAG: sulfite exporter TauE/SafE family protein [Chlorobi bacterium]|nr:sulfite exporter TauE/SafE family protein [Chlorobiota bacterium]
MHFYLPIALTSINILLIIGLGFFIGIISGLFGVGGGFLMTPLLITIGIHPTVAAASDSLQIVGNCTSGTIAHWRLGNVDFKMGLSLLIGSLIGGGVGVELIKIFRKMGDADFVIEVCYVLMLGIVGTYMFFESLKAIKQSKQSNISNTNTINAKKTKFNDKLKKLPFQIYYKKSGITHSLILVLLLGGFVGTLAAIMGVGGGFIMVPAMIYILKIPICVVIGTNLFQEIFLSIEISFLQANINHTVDIILALLLLIGSAFGAQIGAKICTKFRSNQLKILLAIIIIAVAVQMIFNLTLQPQYLLSFVGSN